MKTHRSPHRPRVAVAVGTGIAVAIVLAGVVILLGQQRAGMAQATVAISLDAPVSFPADI